MATGLHGSARTTPRVRAELQASQESTRALAARYGLNVKTVAKWRRSRSTATDKPMGPAKPCSARLSDAEEAMVVELKRRTLLPVDDPPGHLCDPLPQLTRSALHRCLVRQSISRLPSREPDGAKHGKFDPTEIGYLHIDSCELRLEQRKQPCS